MSAILSGRLFWGKKLLGRTANTLDNCEFAPIYFSSGYFRGSSVNWGTPDKELYPVIKSLIRFHFLTEHHPGGVKLFTDHLNLIYKVKSDRSLGQLCFLLTLVVIVGAGFSH